MSKTPLRAGQAAPTAQAGALERFATDVFTRTGMTRADAALVADVLVWANLRGVDTHGVMRIPRYVDLIETGEMNPRPAIAIRTETPASVLIEADRAAGPVAMMRGTTEALRKARDAGVGLALVRATTHTAALGYYTLAAAREGMAAIALAASWPNVAYHGARAAGVSTSPISIAVPGAQPIVLDMATSVVSMGKLNQAKRTGEPIPEGWALDKDGNPTTDPQAAQIPLPMAKATLRKIEAAQRRHDAAVQAGDAKAVFRANFEFHNALFATCGNAYLAAAIEDFRKKTQVVWSYAIVKPEYFRNAQREHKAMLKALSEGNRRKLIELCAAHLDISRHAYVETHRLRYRG